MKRTQSKQINPAFPECNIVTNHVLYVGGIDNSVYGGLVDHICAVENGYKTTDFILYSAQVKV